MTAYEHKLIEDAISSLEADTINLKDKIGMVLGILDELKRI